MKSTICALVVAATLFSGPAPSGAATTSATNEQCVVHVVDTLPSGEFVLSEPECYETLVEAMAAEGVSAWGEGAADTAERGATATFTIGIHYDGASFTGASMSVVGEDCNGGWLNVSAAWDNRISSTRSGCPQIRHYSGSNLSGSSQSTFSPGGNLTSLNNLTSSIQYLG